jgi:Family of unknown function (DUF5678)
MWCKQDHSKYNGLHVAIIHKKIFTGKTVKEAFDAARKAYPNEHPLLSFPSVADAPSI